MPDCKFQTACVTISDSCGHGSRYDVLWTLQTKNLIGEGIEEQTEQALKNMGAILDAAGSSFSQVLKTTVLLTDMEDFAAVNEVYGERSPRQSRSEIASHAV